MSLDSPVRLSNGHQLVGSPSRPVSTTNGVFQSSFRTSGMSASTAGGVSRRVSHRQTSSSPASLRMADTVARLKKRCAEQLGAVLANDIISSYAQLVEWISAERLRRLPTEGSAWDKVLAWAQSFAEKFNEFDLAVEHFTGGNYDGAELAFGYCILLLELGEDNASALQASFGFFFKCSLDLIALLDRVELFNASDEITEQLILGCADLVTLVSDISLRFYQVISKPTAASTSIDIYVDFASTIDSFQTHRENVVESMWKNQIAQQGLDLTKAVDVTTIRNWLEIEDSVLRYKSGDHTTLVNDRQQLTCLWFQPYLTRFLNSNTNSLTVTGPAGSGKTVLAGTVVDALQRSTASKSCTTLFVPVNGRVQASSTGLQIVRSLLSQLFETRVGNVQLYQILVEAYQKSLKATDVASYEVILWTALEKAIEASLAAGKDTIVVVDGLDEVSTDPKQAQPVFKHLTDAISKHEKVKLITFSHPEAVTAGTTADVEINEDIIYDDIFAVIATLLAKSHLIQNRSQIEQDIVISQIVDASNGSFLLAKLITKTLLRETTAEKFTKAVEAIKKSPKSAQEVIREHLATANLSEEGKQLLVWLTIAQRPLAVRELSLLGATDPIKGVIAESPVDVLSILRPITSLIFLQDGLIYLRHAVIRTTLIQYFEQQKQTMKIKEPALELVLRLLTYLKLTIRDQQEPSFTTMKPRQVESIFSQHPLAEYAIRYWTLHAHSTPLSSPDLPQALKTQLANIFPTSPAVVLLEKACWTYLPQPIEISWLKTSTNIRRSVFNDNHPSVIQSLIILATTYQYTTDVQSSATYFFLAYQLCVKILSRTHPLTIQCANTYLEITSTLTSTTRTQVTTHREEVLRLLIETYTSQYGATSELAISTKSLLIELYRQVKEEQKALEIEKTIETGTVETETGTGPGKLGRHASGSLGVRVKTRDEARKVEYREWDFEEARGDAVVHVTKRTYEELLRLAEEYTKKGEFMKAEQAYIEAWQKISEHSQRSVEVESRRIHIAVLFANFLKTQKRDTEAGALLTGVWYEYEHSSVARSEQVNTQLVTVGKTLQSFGLVAVALNVFRHCSTYFKATNKQQTEMSRSVEQSLQVAHQEVMKQASSSSATATHLSESILTEITTTLESSKTTQLDVTSVSAVRHIVVAYIEQHRWKETTTIIKKTLRILWPTLFSQSTEDVGQPKSNPEFAIDLADKLVTCYLHRFRLERAQTYRERVYRSVKSVHKIDDAIVKHHRKELLNIYERTRSTDKIIHLYQELLVDYRKAFGPDHPEVVEVLFTLARLTHPEPVSIEYYRQIVNTLTKDSDTCHPRAIDALITIADHYWAQRRYPDSSWAYGLLFRTFVHKGKETKQLHNHTLVHTIYSRYITSLRETFTDITVIYQRTTEYRKSCIDVFSATNQASIEATLILARLCQSTKRYESESIILYEQLLKDSHASHYHQEIKATLDAIYEEQALEAARSVTVSATSEQTSRAVTIISQRMQKNRSQYGWAHSESLSQLKELTYLYSKQEKSESAVSELTEATRSIVSSEQSSSSLVAGASAVASSFIAINQTHRGIEMAEELRWQLVTKDTSNAKKYNVDVTKTSRAAAIYVAQLEYELRQDRSTSFNEIYLSILTEIVYYEDFTRSIRSNESIESVFSIAARLYSFLLHRERRTLIAHVENELCTYFLRVSGDKARVGDVAQVKILVITMLEYLHIHQTKDFVRSVNVATIERVKHLLHHNQHKQATDLAQTAFRYIHAHNGYNSTIAVKSGVILALTIADMDGTYKSAGAVRPSVVQVAGNILRQMLTSARQLNMNVAFMGLHRLNTIVNIFGEEKDYVTLEALLTTLWNSREANRAWRSTVTLTLGRQLILVRYLTGKHDQALHLATDIAYNLRRVHGPNNLATLEMNILLSQLCISIGQVFQAQKGAEGIAHRYYKRAAGVHENVLRSLTLDTSGLGEDDDATVHSHEAEPIDVSSIADKDATVGKYARKHLYLLKLALERYGGYPKGYAEYERLNADIFRNYPEELKGFQGVEKWDLKKFGSGKAENNDGAMDTSVSRWSLVTANQSNGHGVDASVD